MLSCALAILPSFREVTHLKPRIPLFALPLFILPLFAQQTVRYELRFPQAAHHEAEITATFLGVHQPVLEVVMSRSSPGRYALHEFAKNIYAFHASDGQGTPLTVSRPDPYQWNVAAHAGGTVVITYTLFGDRADGTYAAIDSTHAHLNLPATLAWAHGWEKIPVSIHFEIPAGSDWTVATQLAAGDNGTYSAPNLDRLMDSPVEISHHDLPKWNVGDAQFRLSLHHNGSPEEAAAYARMCQAVVTEEEGVFGAFPRYDTGIYTFLIDYLPYVSGDGMEHRNSTVITSAADLKTSASQTIGIVSHEFFHSWNVKRIRPRSLEPFDFERANMSGELWFAEGFTNYYGPLTLARAGLASLDRFAFAMSGAVTAVLTAPGRQVFNVVDMSRQAPFVDAATANDPVNFPNTFISYYTYGQALALGIDLSIRSRFPGKSLDDWMRSMWRHHPDAAQPYTLDDLQSALAEATGSAPFADEIFRRHIYGMEPMDYESLLGRAGLLLQKNPNAGVFLGNTRLEFSDKGVELAGPTLHGSPIFDAGLDRGDRIVAWEGKPIRNDAELNAWLHAHKPGDQVQLSVDSRSGHRDVNVTLRESPALQILPYERVGRAPSPDMLTLRNAWLSSKAVHPLPKLEKYCPVCKRALPFDYEHCPFDGSELAITPPK